MRDTCNDFRERIAEAMVSGKVLPPDIERHVAGCPECAQFVDALRDDGRRLSRFAEVADASIKRVEKRVRLALQEGAVAPLLPPKTLVRKRVVQIAAAAVVVVAVITSIGYMTGRFGAATPAWADVVEKIEQAVSVTYTQRFEREGLDPLTSEQSVSAEGRLRSVLESGDVSIWDFNRHMTLHLSPHSKRATLVRRTGYPKSTGLFNYVDWIRTLHRESGPYIRTERIDGVKANVFDVVENPFVRHTIWVDEATDLPVRVETTYTPADSLVVVPSLVVPLADYGGDESVVRTVSIASSTSGITRAGTMTKTSFRWNTELDDSLFSLEAPEGYELNEREVDVSPFQGNDLTCALKMWVDLTGGSLPVRLEDLVNEDIVRPILKAHYDRDGDPVDELQEALAIAHTLLKGMYWAQQMRIWGDWDYLGATARVGDPTSLICWWSPKGSGQYRGIYGDFRLDSVPPETLGRER